MVKLLWCNSKCEVCSSCDVKVWGNDGIVTGEWLSNTDAKIS